MATRPTIEINFKQLATTLMTRSERGTAILLLNELNPSIKVYKTVADIDENLYTADNLKAIKNCMAYAPYECVVIAESGTRFSDFTADILSTRSTGWIASNIETSDESKTVYYNPGAKVNDIGVDYGDTTAVWANTSPTVSMENNGKTYTTAIKIQNNCEIKFTVPEDKSSCTFLIYGKQNNAGDFLIDGKSIKADTSGADFKDIVTVSLDKGEHTITRGSKDYQLFGIEVTYSEGAMQEDLATWIKAQENAGKTYKAVGTIANKDCKHYVYFNQRCRNSAGNIVLAVEYLPSLLGIVASCNVTKGCTNFLCSDLKEVVEVADIDAAVNNGQLVLTNDIGGVRIVTGCNSLTTLNGNTATEDMQYIETVEAMDLIRDDIYKVFKTTYQGKFKNKYKYQILFISAVNQYFSQLANEDILDDEYDNRAEIDVAEQRSAWVGTGKSEAEEWSENKVKTMAYKRTVFVKGNIKILNCMENLKFTVTLE
jgi:hypothetical protein|nr:MAG TPA: tail protein [Caudoviricetes sp.]DAT63657.1 MAG TPA: tail protein [Caudoviricetes sp.]